MPNLFHFFLEEAVDAVNTSKLGRRVMCNEGQVARVSGVRWRMWLKRPAVKTY